MVSVIITTYKREPFILKRAIDSVLKQTFRDIELIIVDDNPSEYIYKEEICRMVNQIASDIPVYLFQHEKNMGACFARNTGLQHAKGDYVGFLDDDDEWDEDKIYKQIKRFQELDDETALVYCGCKWIKPNNKIKYKPLIMHSGYVFDELILVNFVGGTSVPLMKTECVRAVGGFDVHMQSAQDFDLWLRLAAQYKIGFINEPLVRFHYLHPGEQISTNPIKKLNGVKRVFDKYSDYLNNHSDAKWNCYRKLSSLYALNGKVKMAFSIYSSMIKIKPLKFWHNFLALIRIFKKIVFKK